MTFPDEDEREASLVTFAFCAAHHCYHPPPARTSQHPAPSSSKMCSAALRARCGGMTALGVAVGGCLTLLMLQVRPLIEAGRLLCRSTCTDTDWLCERMKECVSKHAAQSSWRSLHTRRRNTRHARRSMGWLRSCRTTSRTTWRCSRNASSACSKPCL